MGMGCPRSAFFRCGALIAMLVLCASSSSFAQVPTTIHKGNPAIEGEILVRLRTAGPTAPAASTRVTNVLLRNALPAAEVQELSPALGVNLVRVPGRSVQELLQAFSNDPDVLYAEPNYIVQAVATPNDPLYSALYGLTKI